MCWVLWCVACAKTVGDMVRDVALARSRLLEASVLKYGNASREIVERNVLEAGSTDRLVHRIQEKIKEGLVSDRVPTLLFSFTGDSVVAAHESYFNQSYPHQFYALGKPIFAAAGIQLAFQNQAMGDIDCMQHTLCTATAVSPEADVVSFDVLDHSSACAELFIRTLTYMKSKPIPLLVNHHASRSSESLLQKRYRSQLFEDGTSLLDYYADTGVHFISAEAAFFNTTETRSTTSRSMIMKGKKFQKSPKWWHYGPYGFDMIGRILALNYATILHTALLGLLSPPLPLPSPILPPPLSSKLPFQRADTQYPVQCATSFIPISNDAMSLLQFADPGTFSRDVNATETWVVDIVSQRIRDLVEVGPGYIDYKRGLVGRNDSTPLRLTISTTATAPIRVCAHHHRRDHTTGPVTLLQIQLDGKPVTPKRIGRCVATPPCPAGNHALSIRVNPNSSKTVAVTHLLFV